MLVHVSLKSERRLGAYRERAPEIAIDPRRVNLIRKRAPEPVRFFGRLQYLGLPWPARRGAWNQRAQPLQAYATFRKVAQVIDADLDYRRTPVFAETLQCLSRKGRGFIGPGRRRPVTSEEALVQHYERLCHLIESMRQHGFDTRKARPMTLAIGRRGQFIKDRHEHHRMSVAHLLGLRQVPFSVLTIHSEWVKREFGTVRVSTETLAERLSARFNAPVTVPETIAPDANPAP
ncbi:hypothetical protein [Alkalilimnicola ehrlichii]|uniref:hypothetical protein n=1 Tax=Alkalilimnicola ehrlichii TaxID=351052 RepID=UPI003BA1B3D6